MNAASSCLGVLALLLLSGAADDAQTMLARISAQRTAVGAAAPDERAALVEGLLTERDRLIRDHPDDPRRALWLADQASDLFFLVLPIDSSGLVARFGLPTPGQLQRARRAAREIYDLAGEAELELERVVLVAESGLRWLDPLLLGAERNRRIPFLRGVGACLHADLNIEDPGSRQALYKTARSRLEPLGDLLPGRLAVAARLYAGFAQLGTADYDTAAVTLRIVIGEAAADPGEVFAARMGLVQCRAATEGVDAALGALDEVQATLRVADDLPFRVLIADERFRLSHRRAMEASGARRDRLLADAFEAYMDLARADHPDNEAPQALALARLIRVADADTPLDQLPGLVAVARAGNLAETTDGRAAAIVLYENLLAAGHLDDAETAWARFGLARAVLADGDRPSAAWQFIRLAREHPASPRAEASIELAATLTAELNRLAPDDATYRDLLREALELLLDRYPNLARVDHWRYRLGCLTLQEGRYDAAAGLFQAVPPDAVDRVDALYRRAQTLRAWTAGARGRGDQQTLARRLLEAVDAAQAVTTAPRPSLSVFRAEALLILGDPDGALEALRDGADDDDAHALRIRIEAYRTLGRHDDMTRALGRLVRTAEAGPVLAAMIEARRRDVQTLVEREPAVGSTVESQRELAAIAQATDRWLNEHGPNEAIQLRTANAYRLAARCGDALRLYDDLLTGRPDTLEVVAARAECLFTLERYEQAMALYRRISAATATELDDQYWQSQLRMLQILSRTGRNVHRIAPYVQQLRVKDPELGGDRFRREFEALERSQ